MQHALFVLLFTQGYKQVPARVKVDIVYEMSTTAAQCCILHRELRKMTRALMAVGLGR